MKRKPSYKYRREVITSLLKDKNLGLITGRISTDKLIEPILEEWVKEYNLEIIGAKFGVSASTIRAQFSKVGVSETEIRRLCSIRHVKKNYKKYKNKGLNNYEISRKLEMSHHKLLMILKSEGLYEEPIHYVTNEEIVNEVVGLYNKGYRQFEISDIVNISRDTVSKILFQEGLRGYTPAKLSTEEIDDLVEMYLEGVPVKEIMDYFDIVSSTVYKILDWKGIKRRNPDYQEKEKRVIRDMFENAVPIKDIEDYMKEIRRDVMQEVSYKELETLSVRSRLKVWYGVEEYKKSNELREHNIMKPIIKDININKKGKVESLERYGISEQRYNAYVSLLV